jgi:hypothetical protein
VIVLAASAGVAAASVLLNGTEDPGVDSDAVPGSASAEARADDPRGGLPFGVLVWRNAAGYTCAALGRRVGDRITDASGTRDYPVDSGGGCVDLAALSGDLDVRRSGEHRGQGSELEPVTVVWGARTTRDHAGRSAHRARQPRGARHPARRIRRGLPGRRHVGARSRCDQGRRAATRHDVPSSPRRDS